MTGAFMLVERNARAYRHALWPLVSGFVEPVFYLLSLGLGVGVLVGDVEAFGSAVPYPVFVAPALLAASAMNGAIFDGAYNLFWKMRYARLYEAMLATPLRPVDVATGELLWALARGAAYATAFLAVAAIAGAARSWWAVLALPASVLVGLAFGGAGMAAATFMRSWQDFDLVQLVLLPLFLLSATFYPLSVYAAGWRPVVQASPLYQATALCRELMLGAVGPATAGHVVYLVVMGLAGLAVAARRIDRALLR